MSDLTYYFCEPCGYEWKDESFFIQKCPQCRSDNIYVSEAPENQENQNAE